MGSDAAALPVLDAAGRPNFRLRDLDDVAALDHAGGEGEGEGEGEAVAGPEFGRGDLPTGVAGGRLYMGSTEYEADADADARAGAAWEARPRPAPPRPAAHDCVRAGRASAPPRGVGTP
jgi:hypothetical protein